MYSLNFRLPPEQRLARTINSARKDREDEVVDWCDEHITTSIFTEEVEGWKLSKSLVARLDADTGKFDMVLYREHQGWRWLLDVSRLNRIFTAAADPKVTLCQTLKTGADFHEAMDMLRQFETETRKTLPIHEGAQTVHNHYSFVQALQKGDYPNRETVIEIEPEALKDRAEPAPKACCRCDGPRHDPMT